MSLVAPNLDGFEWKDVRYALKSAIEMIAPLAKVIPEWRLEFEAQGNTGKYVPSLMNGTGAHSQFVHCYMMAITGQTPNTNGGNENTIGGATVDYDLSVVVFGFFDYNSWRVKFASSDVIPDNTPERNSTAFAEYESRALKAVVARNPTLGLQTGRVRYCYPVQMDNSDNHPFSNGKQLIVTQHTVRIRVRESYA